MVYVKLKRCVLVAAEGGEHRGQVSAGSRQAAEFGFGCLQHFRFEVHAGDIYEIAIRRVQSSDRYPARVHRGRGLGCEFVGKQSGRDPRSSRKSEIIASPRSEDAQYRLPRLPISFKDPRNDLANCAVASHGQDEINLGVSCDLARMAGAVRGDDLDFAKDVLHSCTQLLPQRRRPTLSRYGVQQDNGTSGHQPRTDLLKGLTALSIRN